MESKVYNQKGKEVGMVSLPEEIFGLEWNADLVHQVVVGMQANARTPVAHTKDRSDVRGGGKKPWRQKGTGRARHGSNRSPIWKGGGVTFGPRKEKIYAQKINKKMRAKALYTALSQKVKDNEVLFVDALTFSKPKASDAKDVLTALASIKSYDTLKTKKKNNAFIAIPKKDISTKKSFQNFGNVAVGDVRSLNPVDILTYKYLVITSPEKAVEVLSKKLSTANKATVSVKKVAPKKVAPKKVVAKKAPAKTTTKKKTNLKPKS